MMVSILVDIKFVPHIDGLELVEEITPKPANQFIPPHLVTSFSLSNGCKVKGEIEEYTDNRTGDPKTRIKNIELI